jgi:hypothetical protein
MAGTYDFTILDEFVEELQGSVEIDVLFGAIGSSIIVSGVGMSYIGSLYTTPYVLRFAIEPDDPNWDRINSNDLYEIEEELEENEGGNVMIDDSNVYDLVEELEENGGGEDIDWFLGEGLEDNEAELQGEIEVELEEDEPEIEGEIEETLEAEEPEIEEAGEELADNPEALEYLEEGGEFVAENPEIDLEILGDVGDVVVGLGEA